MPKMKGETEQQWMERIRAARCYLNGTDANEGTEFQAFMHLFHPGHRLTGTVEGLRVARELTADGRRRRGFS